MSVDIQPVEWIVGDPLDEHLRIIKCFGSWLPQQPMWKVREGNSSLCLTRGLIWEREPSPTARDDSFYRRCRFETFEQARDAAMKALEVEVKHVV